MLVQKTSHGGKGIIDMVGQIVVSLGQRLATRAAHGCQRESKLRTQIVDKENSATVVNVIGIVFWDICANSVCRGLAFSQGLTQGATLTLEAPS